jgi:hypothetical protein
VSLQETDIAARRPWLGRIGMLRGGCCCVVVHV